MDSNDGTVEVFPRTIRLDLTAALNISQPVPGCERGQLITGYTINLLPATLNVVRAYGNQPPTRCYQGQNFSFGTYGDCIGVMKQGLYLGCNASPGDFIELEVYFAPDMASIRSSQ